MQTSLARWRSSGALIALGGLVLFIGLMTGPTPGDDAAEALRNIDHSSLWYVSTNVVDIIGVLILLAGFASLARLLLNSADQPGASVLAVVGMLLGASLLLLVLVPQTVVDPNIASRYVSGSESEQGTQLAVARAMFDFEGGLFALALLLEMWGVAAAALALVRAAGPAIDRRFLRFGAVVSFLAGLTGVLALVEPLGSVSAVEPVFSLFALLWLIAFGVVLYRTRETRPEAETLSRAA